MLASPATPRRETRNSARRPRAREGDHPSMATGEGQPRPLRRRRCRQAPAPRKPSAPGDSPCRESIPSPRLRFGSVAAIPRGCVCRCSLLRCLRTERFLGLRSNEGARISARFDTAALRLLWPGQDFPTKRQDSSEFGQRDVQAAGGTLLSGVDRTIVCLLDTGRSKTPYFPMIYGRCLRFAGCTCTPADECAGSNREHLGVGTRRSRNGERESPRSGSHALSARRQDDAFRDHDVCDRVVDFRRARRRAARDDGDRVRVDDRDRPPVHHVASRRPTPEIPLVSRHDLERAGRANPLGRVTVRSVRRSQRLVLCNPDHPPDDRRSERSCRRVLVVAPARDGAAWAASLVRVTQSWTRRCSTAASSFSQATWSSLRAPMRPSWRFSPAEST